jgi:hypothetical protein
VAVAYFPRSRLVIGVEECNLILCHKPLEIIVTDSRQPHFVLEDLTMYEGFRRACFLPSSVASRFPFSSLEGINNLYTLLII